MRRALWVALVLLVLLAAMSFARANASHRVTVDLWLFTLYRVPVTLVAFSGLLVGMLVMFGTGVHSDLKVREILRARLAQEAQDQQRWIDGNQKDLFEAEGTGGDAEEPERNGADGPRTGRAADPGTGRAADPGTGRPADPGASEEASEKGGGG